ncbi:MAG: sigma-70 family RNA polymerase sigma factor [Clostridia bacterium]|nr:sigma-70 family RNA polymerase sigma factor [Clostridia bacterium]
MEELYKEYSKLVYNYLHSLCGSHEIAEELTQETFYKAIAGIKNFRNDCRVSSWLCQIAKNLWKDYLRKEKKVKLIPIDDDSYIESLIIEKSLENHIEDRSEIVDLYKQIHKLDEKTKEVFLLRIKGELSFKEIGEILSKSEEWARITFYRGKIKLKEELDNDKK